MALGEAHRPRGRIAEARRNRESLIAAASKAFASGNENVAMTAVAQSAGVGIGTLYRHFPTKEALVEAVYLDQVDRLAAAARSLLDTQRPADALRQWVDVFVDWAATKHGMTETLRAVIASGRLESGQMRAQLVETVSLILEAGVAEGDFRPDVDAADLAAALAGVLSVAGAPDQRDQAGRILNLLVDGLCLG